VGVQPFLLNNERGVDYLLTWMTTTVEVEKNVEDHEYATTARK
jgi:hypothetical protein